MDTERQTPVPEMPSSQSLQPSGHLVHEGPKKPSSHCSHELPVKPVAHAHVPDDMQMPLLEHDGEQRVDCMSRRVQLPLLLVGSCETSGMDSQNTRRSFEPPLIATHVLEASAIDLAEMDVELEEFDGDDGSS